MEAGRRAKPATGRLGDARNAFRTWTEQHPDDPAGWYNLGLVQAWLGDNPAAVEALGRYVERETDESKAGAAWALAEVLRCGHGMEREADYVEHRAVMVLSDPRPLVNLLQQWEQGRRLIGMRSDPEQGMLSALVLDEVPSLVLSGASSPPARLAAYLLVVGNVLQLWHPNAESLDKVLGEARQRLGPAVGEPQRSVGPINFGDVVAEALLFPTAPTTELDAEAKMRDHAQQFFEDTWIHRPYRGLAGVPPIDAAGQPQPAKTASRRHPVLSRIVPPARPRGSTTSTACAASSAWTGAPATGPAAATTPAATTDISAMSAAELSALDPADCRRRILEQAFRTAVQLDAGELAVTVCPKRSSAGRRTPPDRIAGRITST